MKKLWIVTVKVQAVALAETESEACQAVGDNIRDVMDGPGVISHGRVVTSRADVRACGYTEEGLPWEVDPEDDTTVGEWLNELGIPERASR